MRCAKCRREMLAVAEKGKTVLRLPVRQIVYVCWECGISRVQDYQLEMTPLEKKILEAKGKVIP